MPNIFFLFPVLRLAIERVTKGKKKEFGARNTTKNSKFEICQFFTLVTDLGSGSVSVSDLDNNSFWFGPWISGCPTQSYVLYTTDTPCQDCQCLRDRLGNNTLSCARLQCAGLLHIWANADQDLLHPFFGVKPNCLEGLLVSRSRV